MQQKGTKITQRRRIKTHQKKHAYVRFTMIFVCGNCDTPLINQLVSCFTKF